MDTGEDDLLKTALSEAFNFIEHVGKLPASHPASGVRDDAVTAELVAAVLHFNIGSRVLCRVGNFQLLVLFLMGQILEVFPGLMDAGRKFLLAHGSELRCRRFLTFWLFFAGAIVAAVPVAGALCL